MTTKICFKCSKEKDLTDFYRHGAMADGRLNKCKECTKKDVRQHRIDNPGKLAAYERERYKTPKRKKQAADSQRRQRKRNPQKYLARGKAWRAVKSGKLQRGLCEVCNSPDTEAHHDDYSKPLEVRWFCFEHHLDDAHGGCFKDADSTHT